MRILHQSPKRIIKLIRLFIDHKYSSELKQIYERFMQNQMYPYLNPIFPKYRCGFRKGYIGHYCLMAMIEKYRKLLETGGIS